MPALALATLVAADGGRRVPRTAGVSARSAALGAGAGREPPLAAARRARGDLLIRLLRRGRRRGRLLEGGRHHRLARLALGRGVGRRRVVALAALSGARVALSIASYMASFLASPRARLEVVDLG